MRDRRIPRGWFGCRCRRSGIFDKIVGVTFVHSSDRYSALPICTFWGPERLKDQLIEHEKPKWSGTNASEREFGSLYADLFGKHEETVGDAVERESTSEASLIVQPPGSFRMGDVQLARWNAEDPWRTWRNRPLHKGRASLLPSPYAVQMLRHRSCATPSLRQSGRVYFYVFDFKKICTYIIITTTKFLHDSKVLDNPTR